MACWGRDNQSMDIFLSGDENCGKKNEAGTGVESTPG